MLGLLSLWGVLTVVFFLFHILPGDPARMMLDKREDSEQLLVLKQKYGFDKKISTQYLFYINDLSPIALLSNNPNDFHALASGKYKFYPIWKLENNTLVVKFPYLRESFVRRGKPVVDIILETFPNTFVLATTSILIALFLGIILGVFAAVFRDTLWDKMILFFSVFGMSVPSFFSAILMAWCFGFLLSDFTTLSMTGSLFEVDDYGRGEFLNLKNLILPSITLGMRPLSVIVQLTRNSLLEVIKADYMRTAIAKGLSKFVVLFKHGLRNALNPVITAISGWFASLLAGAVFVEYVFAWNGMGKEMVVALSHLDLPVVMGIVLFIAFLFVIINIVVDVLYSILDPRVSIN